MPLGTANEKNMTLYYKLKYTDELNLNITVFAHKLESCRLGTRIIYCVPRFALIS